MNESCLAADVDPCPLSRLCDLVRQTDWHEKGCVAHVVCVCVCRVERLRECNVIRSAHQSTERNAIPKNVNQLITCCVYTIP